MKNFNKLIDKLGGRKFFLVLFIFLINSFLIWLPEVYQITTISKEDFLTLAKVLLIAYPLANVGQTFALNSYPATAEGPSEEDLVGGRKYTLILVMYLFFVCFTLGGQLSSDMYVEFTQWLVAVYFTGNIAGKLVDNGLSVTSSKK